MKYLSVCSGIEAATVAWNDLGYEPVGFSEIEKFPSEVLKYHYPNVPNLGDMTKYKEWDIGTVDLLVGGTPCQSFSVAGLRKGLEDQRGNLALTYVGILEKFRPKWFVWENVPGVLSSNGGRDFGSFLGVVAKLGYGFAYRVLDAQYFGVAQRRRRVFVVGCFGDWGSATKVLFEPESLRRDTKKSGKKREETAKCLTTGIGRRLDFETDTFVIKPILFESRSPDKVGVSDSNTVYTLTKTDVHAVAYGFTQCDAARDAGNNISPTLRSGGDGGYPNHAVSTNMAVRRLTPIECERLQGFPDNYTDIKPKGKDTPDGPRYKALGNSMAVPVMRWIGKRIING